MTREQGASHIQVVDSRILEPGSGERAGQHPTKAVLQMAVGMTLDASRVSKVITAEIR